MPDVIRIGVAGLGEAATEFLPAYAEDQRVKVVAAADARTAARERFRQEFNGAAYATVEELCQSSDVDVVYVSTPHECHVEHALTALANGKHIIVEKPMALTLADCETMNRAAEERNLKILCGHNHSYDAAVMQMRELIVSGQFGRVRMINAWNYNDFMVRPYPDYALETSRGVILNQGPHQIDTARLLAGGMVTSVRATIGRWDESRPGEGSYLCYLQFQDGTAASLVYNGYGFFDTAEFMWWLGEGGGPRYPEKNWAARKNYTSLSGPERTRVIEELKEKMRYGNVGLGEIPDMPHGWEKGGYRPADGSATKGQPRFGLVMVSCERADMRQSQDGILVYGDERLDIPIESRTGGRKAEIDELYNGLVHGRPMRHDGRWGQATMEVCLAILQSAEEGREISMSHQVPTRD